MYIYVYTCTCKVYIHNVMYMYMLGAEHGFVRSVDCPARSVDLQSSTMLLARLHCSYHQPSGKQWPLPLIMHVQSRDYVLWVNQLMASAKHGSTLCTGQSTDCANPCFAPNIYMHLCTCTCTCTCICVHMHMYNVQVQTVAQVCRALV